MTGRRRRSVERTYFPNRPIHDDGNKWVRCPDCKQWARIEYGELKRHRVYESGTDKWAWCYGKRET